MNERELDSRLTAALGEAFCLSRLAEDALWSNFVRRRAREKMVWAGFATALVRAGAALQEVVCRPAWPASLGAHFTWR